MHKVGLGNVYSCHGGWVRRVTHMRETVPGFIELKYASGATVDDLKPQPTWHPLEWFTEQIVAVEKQN